MPNNATDQVKATDLDKYAIGDETLSTPSFDSVSSDLGSGTPSAGLAEEVLVEEEILVEEISIDGMCGVY